MDRKILLSWGILLLLSLIWGSSFILMKKALVVFPPVQVACLRIGLSSILFFPIFLQKTHQLKRKNLLYILIVALSGSGLPAFFYAIAQTEISSSLAGIINSLTPLFTFTLGILFFRQHFSKAGLVGVTLGLAGAVLLVYMSGRSQIEGSLLFTSLAVTAAICYAISGNTVHRHLREMSAFGLNATTFSLLGPWVIGYLLTTDFFSIMGQEEGAWKALGYIAILSWIGTFAATVIFFQLVKWNDALFASSVSYFIPIIAVGWGLLDGEILEWYHWAGLLLIIREVYAIRKAK